MDKGKKFKDITKGDLVFLLYKYTELFNTKASQFQKGEHYSLYILKTEKVIKNPYFYTVNLNFTLNVLKQVLFINYTFSLDDIENNIINRGESSASQSFISTSIVPLLKYISNKPQNATFDIYIAGNNKFNLTPENITKLLKQPKFYVDVYLNKFSKK